MKETTHRLVLFAVIVGTGSVLIFVDIPLIYLIPLIMAVGFLLLILLGSITVAEIKNALSIQSFKKIRQQSSSKRSDSVNLSGKKNSPKTMTGGRKLEKTPLQNWRRKQAGFATTSRYWHHPPNHSGRSSQGAKKLPKNPRRSTNYWNIRYQKKSSGDLRPKPSQKRRQCLDRSRVAPEQ